MPILITGSRGYIGSRLCSFFKKNNIPFLEFSGDVQDFSSISPDEINGVIHLAAKQIDRQNALDKNNYLVNTMGTYQVARFCQKHKLPLFFSSTAGIYSQSDELIPETGEIQPNAPYAMAKLLAEHLIQTLFDESPFPVTIARIFNVYGPNQNSQFVVPKIIESLINRVDLKLNQPESVRDFVYIDDVVRLISKLYFKTSQSFEPSEINFLNIGTGSSTTIQEVAHLSIELYKGVFNLSPIQVKFEKVGKPNKWVSNPRKLQKYLEQHHRDEQNSSEFEFTELAAGIKKCLIESSSTKNL